MEQNLAAPDYTYSIVDTGDRLFYSIARPRWMFELGSGAIAMIADEMDEERSEVFTLVQNLMGPHHVYWQSGPLIFRGFPGFFEAVSARRILENKGLDVAFTGVGYPLTCRDDMLTRTTEDGETTFVFSLESGDANGLKLECLKLDAEGAIKGSSMLSVPHHVSPFVVKEYLVYSGKANTTYIVISSELFRLPCRARGSRGRGVCRPGAEDAKAEDRGQLREESGRLAPLRHKIRFRR